MLWWMSISITDNQIIINGIDSRVNIPRQECGDVFLELFHYAIDIPKMQFANIIYKDKYNLKTEIELPTKDEISNFNDLRHTIKSYRYILSVFLSLGVIPELSTVKEQMYFEFIKQDICNRADTLEYFLLNNSPKIQKNQRGYYDGRLELDFFRLIQEMYLLAINGNDKCRWMLAFKTPLQIWFIATIQLTYMLYATELTISNREYYKQTTKYEENIYQDCLKTIEMSKNTNLLHINEALKYTIAQLIVERTPPIGTYYTNYLNSIKKQAYFIAKSGHCHNI